jgi:DNA-binding beta-propeller fold protein YncE
MVGFSVLGMLVTAVQASDLASFSPVFQFGTKGDGPGQFGYVEDLAWTADGRLVVTDAAHAWVQIFDPRSGKFLARFGGKTSTAGGLVKPEGLAVAPNGDVYVADYDTGQIKRYGRDYTWKATYSSFGSGPGQNMRSEFMSIHEGKLYMADAGNHRVDVFALDGKFLFSFGSRGDGPGQLNNPEAAKVNSYGEVFVTDLKNHRIQVFDAKGVFLRTWGKQGAEPGSFFAPAGLAFDAHDNVYVTEIGNNRVQVFTPEGQHLATFGEAGQGPGQLQNVHGIIVAHATGLVYVADSGNQRIQVFAPVDTAALASARAPR